MASFWRSVSRSAVPLTAAFASSNSIMISRQEETPMHQKDTPHPSIKPNHTSGKTKIAGMQKDAQGDYHNLFPLRQLWQPKLEYPLWDTNWDNREPESTGNKEEDHKRMRHIRSSGTTRHIILIRHGVYDETHNEDKLRRLTTMGKEQAELTGKRLSEILKGAEDEFGPCNILSLRVSDMTRAKETAEIISKYLPNVPFLEPDPLLNEGRPCHHIPGTKATEKIIRSTDEGHARIEKAFQKYFHRAPLTSNEENVSENMQGHSAESHEFEVIVCHANVIRYFLMRALQLPPEAWLRYCPFNCSLTYITIRPTGSVSCRMFGDIGHLPYSMATFSQHNGFNW